MVDKDDPTAPVESDPTTEDADWQFAAQAPYDPNEPRDLTTVVVGAIAQARGVASTDVRSPPLYAVADIESIEAALFGRATGPADDTEAVIEFRYNECKVRIDGEGWVTVFERD